LVPPPGIGTIFGFSEGNWREQASGLGKIANFFMLQRGRGELCDRLLGGLLRGIGHDSGITGDFWRRVGVFFAKYGFLSG